MKLEPEALVLQRALAKMTQKELAEAASLSLTSISQFEAGKLSPRKTTIYRLAKALGIEAKELCAPLEEISTTVDVQTKELLEKQAEQAGVDEGVLIATIMTAHVRYARAIVDRLHREIHAADDPNDVYRLVDELRRETQSAALVIDKIHSEIHAVGDPNKAIHLINELKKHISTSRNRGDVRKPD